MDILKILESSFLSYGYLIVFFAAFFESIILLGFLLPGGLIVLLGGYFAQQNQISVVLVTTLAWLGMSDQEFVGRLNKKLKNHLMKVSSKKIHSIICVTHCLPFKELLPNHVTSLDKYLAAFSGSAKLGETILKFPKVKYVFCGHTHQRKEVKVKNITCINIGSDYLRKRYELINI